MAELVIIEPLRLMYNELTAEEKAMCWKLLYKTVKPKVRDGGVNTGELSFERGVSYYYYYLTDGQTLPDTVFVSYEYKTSYFGIAQFPRMAGDNTVMVSHNSVASLMHAMYVNADIVVQNGATWSTLFGMPMPRWSDMTEAMVQARLTAVGVDYDAAHAAFITWRTRHLEFRLSMDLADCPINTHQSLTRVVDEFIANGVIVDEHTPTSEYVLSAYAHGA